MADTLKLSMTFRAKGEGLFYKDSTFKAPYKNSTGISVQKVSTGGLEEEELFIVPSTSLNSFTIKMWLKSGPIQNIVESVEKLLDDWFMTSEDNVIEYKDKGGMIVRFEDVDSLKSAVQDVVEAEGGKFLNKP
jgi:hypothetical protein